LQVIRSLPYLNIQHSHRKEHNLDQTIRSQKSQNAKSRDILQGKYRLYFATNFIQPSVINVVFSWFNIAFHFNIILNFVRAPIPQGRKISVQTAKDHENTLRVLHCYPTYTLFTINFSNGARPRRYVCSRVHVTFHRITSTLLNRTCDRWGVESKSKCLPHVNKRQEKGTISRLEKWLLDSPL